MKKSGKNGLLNRLNDRVNQPNNLSQLHNGVLVQVRRKIVNKRKLMKVKSLIVKLIILAIESSLIQLVYFREM